MEDLKKSFLIRGDNIIGALGDKNFSTAPLGTVLSFAGQTAPHGYLLCNGASYKVADYPDLYAVIGNTYGGDTENFNVPNLIDKFIQGSNTSGTEKEAGLPNITGQFGNESDSHAIFYNSTFGGAFKANKKAKLAGGGSSSGEWYAKALFDASLSNPIYGNSDTVQPPALTMVYIIKAFHTNEGTDSGVGDDVVNYIDNKIAEADTELTAKINTQTANRQVKIFDNTMSSTEKWYKICSALTGGIGCNIKLTGSRADSTAAVQYFSVIFRDSRYRYTSSYISRERTVYESVLVADYSAYIVADANNDIWVHVPSYGKVIIEIDTRAVVINGTVGTPVKDYVYSSFEMQSVKERLDTLNIKQFNQPGSNTSFKYVTITSTGSGLGGLELNVPYAGKYMFSAPKLEPVYFGSSTHKGYTLNGWAWSDDGKTLYLRVGGFAPFSISVLGSVLDDTHANNVVTISDITSAAPEGVTFVTSPVYSNAVIDNSSTDTISTWSSSKIASEIASTYLIKDIAAGGDNEKTFSFKIRKDYFASYYAKRTFLLSANVYSLGFSKPVISLVEIFRGSADNYGGYIVNLQDTRFTGVTVTVNGDYLEVVVTLNSYEGSGCKVSCSSLSNAPIA